MSGDGRRTAVATANIAFVKYWGIRDVERVLPVNPSISMTLASCRSVCTVEPLAAGGRAGDGDGAAADSEVWLREPGGELARAPERFAAGVLEHVARLGAHGGRPAAMKVAAENHFPTGAGLASSAAGFAALTVALAAALGIEADARELSVLARRSGSGSAARSLYGGYVEWPAGDSEAEGHAVPLAPPEHWDLRNVVAIVDPSPKSVSSRDGHARAPSSPYFERRQGELPERLEEVRQAIAARDLERLGPVIEKDAIELHLIAMSSRPPIFYWQAGTLEVLEAARRLRTEGIGVWATIDAGPNVHLICAPEHEERVAAAVLGLGTVRSVIRDRVGEGPSLVSEHLF